MLRKKVMWILKLEGFLAQRRTIVYVIGLHAVQFGNNWMRKIPRTAKLDEAVGRVQFSSSRNFLNILNDHLFSFETIPSTSKLVTYN